jgi:ribosomal protein L9
MMWGYNRLGQLEVWRPVDRPGVDQYFYPGIQQEMAMLAQAAYLQAYEQSRIEIQAQFKKEKKESREAAREGKARAREYKKRCKDYMKFFRAVREKVAKQQKGAGHESI